MLPTIAWQDDAVVMVDQRKLPTREVYVTLKTPSEVAKAIKTMVVRGAPAIGVSRARLDALLLDQAKASGAAIERNVVARAVEDAEKGTSGEIVVHLAATLLPFESARRRALRTFQELGVFRTRLRNGVLLFFVLKKRRFEIVADNSGSADLMDAATYQTTIES